MQANQWQWGIAQWVEYLKDKELPVLPRTRAVLAEIEAGGEAARQRLSALDLVTIVYADPYLALKLLRRAEERRTRQLGHDTTTPLAAVPAKPATTSSRPSSPPAPTEADTLPGCLTCENRSVLASTVARTWAGRRADVLAGRGGHGPPCWWKSANSCSGTSRRR